MKINLEKALIKANRKILTPEELLVVKEYEQHAGIVDNDALDRVGLNTTIKYGKSINDKLNQANQETLRFKQDRVFHISQIKETCAKYYLRFLPSSLYTGVIDNDLPFKISNFEAAYQVKCQCDLVDPETNAWYRTSFALAESKPKKVQNTFIMAPASSFSLQEKPKDPLFFYKINEEYYYLIHKWGNDLSITRRFLGLPTKPWFYYLIAVGIPASAVVFNLLKGLAGIDIIGMGLFGVNCMLLFIQFISFIMRITEEEGYTSFLKNKWNSPYL